METPNYRKASIYFDDETVLEVTQRGGGGSGVGGETGLEAVNLKTGESTNAALAAKDETIAEQAATIETQAATIIELQEELADVPTIEALNVTANGTYSESGKAYSPVNVNVPEGLSYGTSRRLKVVIYNDESFDIIVKTIFNSYNTAEKGIITISEQVLLPANGSQHLIDGSSYTANRVQNAEAEYAQSFYVYGIKTNGSYQRPTSATSDKADISASSGSQYALFKLDKISTNTDVGTLTIRF